jgi:DNA mismatch repair protein MutS
MIDPQGDEARRLSAISADGLYQPPDPGRPMSSRDRAEELEVAPALARSAPAFESVLYPPGSAEAARTPPAPGEDPLEDAKLADLHLDELIAQVLAGHERFALEPLFRATLEEPEGIAYRHEVVRELGRPEVAQPMREFTAATDAMRERLELSGRLRDRYQKQYWHLAAVERWCAAARALERALAPLELRSLALRGLRGLLAAYVASAGFAELESETAQLLAELGEVRYTVAIRGLRVTVARYEGEADLTHAVEETFARFREGEHERRRWRATAQAELDPVEEQVLARVAALNSELFARLACYCERRREFTEPLLARFDREVRFYLAYLAYAARFEAAGLRFSLPEVTIGDEQLFAEEGFDVVLAAKLLESGRRVVVNDFALSGPERFLVVTGPNQGGKTTFARMFGQLHHLAALGLPVPAARARLPLAERLLTHFAREEQLSTLRSDFEDDLVRMREILERSGERTVVVLNESFSGTSVEDAIVIGRCLLTWLIERGARGVLVTFIDELSALGAATVSMMSIVEAADPTRRTYRVERKPADGRAYAVALAERHGLSYEQLRARLDREAGS